MEAQYLEHELLDDNIGEINDITISVLEGRLSLDHIKMKLQGFNSGEGRLTISQRQPDGSFFEGTFCRGSVSLGVGSRNEVGALLILADDYEGAPHWVEISSVNPDYSYRKV